MDETYLNIKRKNGSTVFSTPINEGSKLKYTLMKEHYVTLKFSVDEPIFFKLGDGIECDFGLFELVDLYKPSLNKTNGAFDYELKLDAYYWKWKNKIFKYTPEHYGKEVSWSLTAPLYVHLNVFLRNLVALGYDYKGVPFTYTIDSSVSSKAISVEYNNISMIDALTAMANAITNLHEGDTCEWWLKDNVIHFGKCEFGVPIDFEIDQNVDHMTQSESKDSYASRLIVFGSTKNIPLRYRKNLIFTATSVDGQVMVDVNRPLKPSYFPTESIINSTVDNSFDVSRSKSGEYQLFDEYITDTNTFQKSLKAGTYTYDLSNLSVELNCTNGNNLSTVQTCTIYLKYGDTVKTLGVAQTSLSGKNATLNFSANGTFELDVDKDVSIILETKTGINIRITENPQMEFVYTGILSLTRNVKKSVKATVTFLSGTNKGSTVSCVFNSSLLDVANCNITLPKGTVASIGDTFSIDNIILINVPSSYFTKEDEDLTYNGVVQSRLMMPKDTPCVDIEEGLSQEEYVEEVLVNEEIFPNFSGTVTENPTVGIANYKDEKGNNTEETYPIYNITDSTLKNFKQSYISDKLHIIFQTGALAGLDFELNLRGSDDKGTTFEIVMNSNYGRDLPDLTMKPEKNNTYILYGYDPQFISDILIPRAEVELKAWAIKQKNLKKIDPSTYDCSMMSDVSKPIYQIGQKVNLINKGFFETSRQSRIIGYELNLDYAYDSPLYTVGESAAYSRLSAMEEKIDELKYNGNTYYGSSLYSGGGPSIYIIDSNDNTEMSNSNVLSSLRVLKEISDRAISKTDADTASGIITFLKGIQIGGKSLSDIILSTDNTSDTDIKDSSFLSALRAVGMFLRKDKEDSTEFLVKLLGGIVTTFLKSENFTAGQLGSGFGVYKKADGKSYMEVDELLVRVKAIFSELEIRKLSYVGGNIIFSSAGSKIVRVEEISDTYRCYFMADDGTTATINGFAVGDQARCQTFNIKAGKYTGVANKYYWRLVTAVGDDYIELSKTDCDGTDIPASGDSIVQMGNRIDTTRQNLIEIVVTGDDAPAFIEYAGVNAYSLEGKRKTVLSPKGDEFVAKSFKIQTEDGSVTDLTQYTGYRIEKFTSPMFEFYTEGQTTYKATLSIRIFYNEKDITDTLPSTRFVWSRVSENTAGDPTWNELHESSSSSIDITYQDLAGDTAFICQFLDNDKTVISTTNF